MCVKKTVCIISLALIILFLVWAGFVIHASCLTAKYADEFTDYQTIGFDHMHSWEGTAKIRVLSYGGNSATVYFYSSTGGEKVEFIDKEGVWVYYDTVASWSTTGSADDYFIWPYFKNYVI